MSVADLDRGGDSSIFQDRLAMALVLFGLAIRVLACALIPAGFDEAYYGVYSLYPAWGYFDHPPAVAVTAGLGRWLTGSYSPLSLRLGALVTFVFSAVLMYRLTLLLAGRRAARIALFLLHVTPFFLVGMGAFVFPDNALGLFWLLFLMSLAKVRETGDDKWLLLAGLSLGLALLAKYHAVLLGAAFLYCLVRYPEWRPLLRSPCLYGGLGIAAICFLPNVYWNYQHHWVSYLYQFGKSASGVELSPRLFLAGVLMQVGYILPLTIWLYVTAIILTIRNKIHAPRWLLPFAVLPIAAFTLIGATRSIQPHWPMPGYLAGIVLAAVWMAGWQALWLKRVFWVTGVAMLLITLVVPLQAVTGIFPINPKADLTLDGQGWGEVVDRLADQETLRKGNCFLASHKWFTGGELAYAARGRFLTTVLNRTDPHGFAFWTNKSDIVGKDAIFVTTERFPADPKELYGKYFTEYTRLDDIQTFRSGRPAQVFRVWICRNLQKPYPRPYGID
ncbi:MAG: glycosyltransferase family 39 protein [Syntrophobacteraceae bacterium]